MTINSTNEQALAKVFDRLGCPHCKSVLAWQDDLLRCTNCERIYPIMQGIPDLRYSQNRELNDLTDWMQHWSTDNQNSLAQRFFSFYRKAVFSRTVANFTNRYFPEDGVFVEAGSGTSETSIRIDKNSGKRVLIALDLVLPVLEHTHPVMDVKICGDIFNLPFQDNSLDGLWNVGVMEHFPHENIHQILAAFHRVLRPGAPLILLWPGTSSLPQKALRLFERMVNSGKDADVSFRFHPPEISQLHSSEEGEQFLVRNGFHMKEADPGWKSLMAFVTIVGCKT
jgi:SAM-dependent methyltransferase